VKRLSETMLPERSAAGGGCCNKGFWLQQAGAAIGMQDMACGDAAAAAAAVREGGQGAAPMELAAVIAVDVCVLEGSLEVEGFPDAASDDPFDVAALFPESRRLPPLAPLDTSAALPPPLVIGTADRRPRPSAVCIDCRAPPPISDDNVPLLVPLPCLHFICHPCWDVLIATIDAEARARPSPGAEPEHPSLAASFCHICHPSTFSPALFQPHQPSPPPRTPPTDFGLTYTNLS